jgi:hypothetical protein
VRLPCHPVKIEALKPRRAVKSAAALDADGRVAAGDARGLPSTCGLQTLPGGPLEIFKYCIA